MMGTLLMLYPVKSDTRVSRPATGSAWEWSATTQRTDTRQSRDWLEWTLILLVDVNHILVNF